MQFADTETTQTVTITPIDDPLAEGPESVVVTLLPGWDYSIEAGHGSGTVTIADNEPMVGITAPLPDASEAGPVDGQFLVQRTGATATALTVRYWTRGTAINGLDYERLTGQVTIPAGQVSAPIDVVPIDDLRFEGDETVEATVFSGVGYAADPEHAATTVTIGDDD